MDSELLYLRERAAFHRRMARQTGCDRARSAHEAFVRAYFDQIERMSGAGANGLRAAAASAPLARNPSLVAAAGVGGA